LRKKKENIPYEKKHLYQKLKIISDFYRISSLDKVATNSTKYQKRTNDSPKAIERNDDFNVFSK